VELESASFFLTNGQDFCRVGAFVIRILHQAEDFFPEAFFARGVANFVCTAWPD
jgi:hypothetical protein